MSGLKRASASLGLFEPQIGITAHAAAVDVESEQHLGGRVVAAQDNLARRAGAAATVRGIVVVDIAIEVDGEESADQIRVTAVAAVCPGRRGPKA